MKKKLLFSLQGVDLNDDAAVEAFAEYVWHQAVAAFGEQQDDTGLTTENGQASHESPGETHA